MRAATTVAVNPKTPSQREGQITKGLERYQDMATEQQGAYENYQIVAQAQALEIMFLDSLRVGPFRIAEITSGLTNAKIMAIVKDGDTSPVPATFNTRQAAVNYCVEQIQTGDICYHPCGAY